MLTKSSFIPRPGARWTLLALCAAILTGCAGLPGPTSPAQRVDATQLGLHDTAAASFPHDDWWRAWGDPELDRLQQQLLSANPDLQLAQARLRQADAAAGVRRAALLPQVGVGLQSTREMFSRTDMFAGTPLAGAIVNESQLALKADWQIDFFGRNRAALEAAHGRADAAAAQAQAARVLLTGALAARYVQLAGELEQGRVLQQMLDATDAQRGLAAERAAAGLEPQIPEHQAEVQLEQIRQQLEVNRMAVAHSRDALAALLGQGPQATAALAPSLQALPTPAVPQQLPAQLLGHRADIAAARWQAEAAQAEVRQARAAFYPNVNLSAFAGYASLGWGSLTQANSRTWGVGPAISLPLFEGGALNAQLHGAQAGADAAVAQYNATVVGAVRDVADALAQQRALQQQLAQQQQAAQHASRISALTRQRYDAGLLNRQSLLQAQLGEQQQQVQQIALHAAALRADVALIQALGGGYADTGSH